MRHIALRLSFDGSAYHGWQRQRNVLSLCELLETALGRLTGETIRLHGCGRTDAGVHARCYVAAFRTAAAIPIHKWPYALNPLLPPDVSVHAAAALPEDFNAIGSISRKEYSYFLRPAPHRDPFWHHRAYHYPRQPELEAMRQAARDFVGRHDFRCVQTTGTVLKTTVRTMHELEVSTKGELVVIRMCADGFLYNMARAIAGTLLYVSEGKITDIPALIQSGDRSRAGPVLPPHGLYMTGVWYREEPLWE